MKRLQGFFLGFMIAFLLMPLIAMAAGTTIEVVLDTVKISVNGKLLSSSNILYKGTTYAPVRAISEALGKTVGWNNGTVTITDTAQTNVPDVSSDTESLVSASTYIKKLKDAGLSIGTVISYDAITDPNELLGKPNQYVSKSNFADTTLIQQFSDDPNGGSVELFTNAVDVNARKELLRGQTSIFTEYYFINGFALLRISRSLETELAEKYRVAFMQIQ